MKNQSIIISVVIPVKNGGPWLDKCIQGIMRQNLFNTTEIIAIDSGSTDDSLKILAQYPVQVIEILAEEFNHGLTRNYAVNYCKGKYIVMTVQDARPVDEYWLERLLQGFSLTENVAGVCGQQVVPHEREANPAGWFRPVSEPSCILYQFASAKEFDTLSPLQKKNCCSWDDVTAMYRKDILNKVPFQKITYGEDALWARDALRAGYAIVYNSAAKVYHYHIENSDYTFRRSLTVLYFRYKIFGYIHDLPRLTVRSFLSLIKTVWTTDGFSVIERIRWINDSLKQHKALKKAHLAFFDALSKGTDDALDVLHDKFCGKPPTSLKENYYETSVG